jgi:hypothetical protein
MFLLALVNVSLYFQVCLGQFVDPYPVNDCSGGVFFGGFTCPSQPGCCSGGAQCCAGGCCPTLSYCVNIGSSDEGCCPFDDPTNCGVVEPTGTSDECSSPEPSVYCSTADDSWYCPPENTCGTYWGQCFAIFVSPCTTSSSDDTAEPTPTVDSDDLEATTSSSSGSSSTSSTPGPRPNDAPRTSGNGLDLLALLAPILVVFVHFFVVQIVRL